MLGCSRITDDQEAAGRACMHTAVLNYSQHNRYSHRLDATRASGGVGWGKRWGRRAVTGVGGGREQVITKS